MKYMERKPVRRCARLANEPIRNGITVALKREEAFGMSANQIEGDLMNNLGKLVVRMGLLSLLCVMPLSAQIENGVDFKTTFPFYAGNAKMPRWFLQH
jgi:hypothetical protein